ncbi:uncharacterized protein LOC119524876 isoform X3 [Choloepus didactylus]|nr:uncharacterized protein LOC119524876 isoform X3 [Choloepus didactylus]XP_037679479.1 uncharacterized protein LOC119524876 isoform X3 [Choloepus didactylus]
MHFLWYFTGSIHSPGSGELQRGSSWARREPVKAPDRESPGGLLGGGGTEAGTKGKGACEGFFHRGGTRSDLHTELSAEEVSPGAGLVPHEVPGRPCCPRMLPEGSYFNKQASLKPTHLAPPSLQGSPCSPPSRPPLTARRTCYQKAVRGSASGRTCICKWTRHLYRPGGGADPNLPEQAGRLLETARRTPSQTAPIALQGMPLLPRGTRTSWAQL